MEQDLFPLRRFIMGSVVYIGWYMRGSTIACRLGAFVLLLSIPAMSYAESKCPDLNASWTSSDSWPGKVSMDGWVIPLRGTSATRLMTRSDMIKTLDNLILRGNPPKFTCLIGKEGTCYDHVLNMRYEKHPEIGRNLITCCGPDTPYVNVLREEHYSYILDSKGSYYLTSTKDVVDKKVVSCKKRTSTLYRLGRMYTKTDNNRIYSDNVVAPYLVMTREVSSIQVTPYTSMPSF